MGQCVGQVVVLLHTANFICWDLRFKQKLEKTNFTIGCTILILSPIGINGKFYIFDEPVCRLGFLG